MCQALGKEPDEQFLRESGTRIVSSILQMRLLLGKTLLSPAPFVPQTRDPQPHALKGSLGVFCKHS